VEFFHDFFKYIREKKSPLDFFSWHSYAGIAENVMYASYVKEQLERYGYGGAESIFNEWNPGIQNRGKAADATNIAAMMCAMQKTPTDMCMYYDGQAHSSYCGPFSGDFHDVFAAYYAFWFFGQLYLQKNEAMSKADAGGVYVSAAAGEKKMALIANTNGEGLDIALEAPEIAHGFAASEPNGCEKIAPLPDGGILHLPPYAAWLLEFK
jgi:hypothetical protein